MRRLITFSCGPDTLVGSLDAAAGTTGVVIVSGGNEARWGAHRGMAMLAARLAAADVPVFRFDRRGVGDSTGENRGYAGSGDDLAAAVGRLRSEQPQVQRIVGFGNCDAATALALFGRAAGVDALVLANPWVIEATSDALPPPAAIRARYAERLRDPREWWRLLSGGVNIAKLVRGLRQVAAPAAPSILAEQVAGALADWPPPTLLIAERDNTAIAFADAWRGPAFARVREAARWRTRATDSHSFARAGDGDWLFDEVLAAVRAAR